LVVNDAGFLLSHRLPFEARMPAFGSRPCPGIGGNPGRGRGQGARWSGARAMAFGALGGWLNRL